MKNSRGIKKKNKQQPLGNNRNKSKKQRFDDPFFEDSERRRRDVNDEEIESSSDDYEFGSEDDEGRGERLNGVDIEEGDQEEETAAEKKKRVAEAYLEKIKKIVERGGDEGKSDDDDEDRTEKDGLRDSLVAKYLEQEQLEESGRVRRAIAHRVQKPKPSDGFQVLIKHRQSVSAVALADDDLKGFSASKNGTILHWDVDTGKTEKYAWPSDDVLKSHGLKDPQGRVTKHSKQILALAVSSDGRYLASGGLDRHVHLWDTRTRGHIQAFPGHKGPVSCLTFRQGTSELFSGSFDRSIKIWNAEDRVYINTLFGHQSEVLTIDCLRKERVLTVGRDRTMHLWKVPEESQLIYRAPASSLECCCFISNDEFLSGSDDGNIEHWNVLRKKPVHIVKNAHASVIPHADGRKTTEELSNGHLDTGIQDRGKFCSSALSWVSSVAVCRSSDLAASGAGNGSVRLWAIESDSKGISPLFELPLVGFVNSLAFAKSGRFLVAGVGQEQRLGRWGRIPAAKNGVAMHALELS